VSPDRPPRPPARASPPGRGPRPAAPRRRAAPTPEQARLRRILSVGALVVAVLTIAGAVVTLGGGPDRAGVAERYTRAWARGDFRAMYAELTPTARKRVTGKRFAELHREQLATATARRLGVAGTPRELTEGVIRVPLVVRTTVFGRVAAPSDLPVAEDGDAVGIDWRRHMAFPGLRLGEELTREVEMPPRATLQARDGSVLADGDARLPAPDVADVAPDVVGQLGAGCARAREGARRARGPGGHEGRNERPGARAGRAAARHAGR
jgi:hypothetical protein